MQASPKPRGRSPRNSENSFSRNRERTAKCSKAISRCARGGESLRQSPLLAAQKLVDLWWTRLDLGVAYAQAEHHAEALGELQRAQNRRGEATSILLDDLPTFRYVAPLVYWNARAQEGTGQHAAAMENYKIYLAIRFERAGRSAGGGRPASCGNSLIEPIR